MSENTPGHFGPPQPYPQTPPGPPTVGPTAPKRTILIALLVAAGLVLVSAVAGGVWLLGSNSAGGKSGSTANGTLWSLPYSASGREFATPIVGTWFQGTTVVKALPDGIEAVDAKSGHRIWGTPTPGDGTVMCQASTDATSGIVVLAYGAAQACDHFYAVDISATGRGRVLWQHTLQTTSDGDGDAASRIARSGDNVVVSGAHEVTTAFRVSTGQQLWTDSSSIYGGQNCHANQYTGGPQLIRIQTCYGADFSAQAQVAAVDGLTGHSKWTYTLGDALDNTSATVLDTSPIVVNTPSVGDQIKLQILTDDGKLRRQLVPGPYKLVSPTLTVENGSPAANITTRGNDLYIVADPATDNRNLANEVVAWSMDTGQHLWDKISNTGQIGIDWFLVGSDGPDVLALLSGSSRDTTSLVRFDATTGRETTMHTYPAVRDTLPNVGGDPYGLLHQGTLYVSAGYVIEASGVNQDKNQVSLVALATR